MAAIALIIGLFVLMVKGASITDCQDDVNEIIRAVEEEPGDESSFQGRASARERHCG